MRKDTLTGRSFPHSFLEPFREYDSQLAGDPSADAVIEHIATEGKHRAVSVLMQYLTDYEQLDTMGQHPAVMEFVKAQVALPDPIYKQRFVGGINVFWKHYRLISLLLGTYSLPYCYAGANGAQVLWISERIKSKTYQRLEETGAFVFGIMQEKDWQNGLNFLRIAKIRLLHAAIRWFTLQSGKWSPAWGYPVCQEDMAGTNLSFSYIIIKGLRKLSIELSETEEDNYLYFWNIVGELLGMNPKLLPQNMLEAYRLDKQIVKRQFRSSEAGKGLTNALLKAIEQQISSPTLKNIPAAQMRFFLGDDVADLLDLPKIHWEERFLKIALQSPIFPQLLTLQKPTSPVLERYWR